MTEGVFQRLGETAVNKPHHRRVLVALFVVGCATLIRFAFQSVLGGAVPFILYYPAVMLSAWYGGFLAGFIATIAGALAADFFFIEPRYSFSSMSLPMFVAFTIFVASSLFMSVLAELRVKGVTAQAKLKGELTQQKQFIEEVLTSIQDAFCVIGRDWRFAYANEHLAALAGKSKEEVVGKPVWEIFPMREPVKNYLEKTMNDGVPVHYETLNPPSQRWLSVHAYPSAQGITIYAVDISPRKEIEKALADAKSKLEHHATNLEREVQKRTAELQETVGQLESFSYTVSHDLRSPLRAMQGFAHMTLEEYGERLDDTGRSYLQRIDAAAKRMDSLIQDVITYNKVARAEMRIEPVDTGKLLDEVIHQYPSVNKPHASFEITRPLAPVLANPAGLVQALANVLTNAVKFVAEGQPAFVKVWTQKHDSKVCLCVEDKGIGIAPESLTKIFEPFHRAHAGAKYEGSGIGLAVAKKAVERMGGTFGVESVVGKGSKFCIELPSAS